MSEECQQYSVRGGSVIILVFISRNGITPLYRIEGNRNSKYYDYATIHAKSYGFHNDLKYITKLVTV